MAQPADPAPSGSSSLSPIIHARDGDYFSFTQRRPSSAFTSPVARVNVVGAPERPRSALSLAPPDDGHRGRTSSSSTRSEGAGWGARQRKVSLSTPPPQHHHEPAFPFRSSSGTPLERATSHRACSLDSTAWASSRWVPDGPAGGQVAAAYEGESATAAAADTTPPRHPVRPKAPAGRSPWSGRALPSVRELFYRFAPISTSHKRRQDLAMSDIPIAHRSSLPSLTPASSASSKARLSKANASPDPISPPDSVHEDPGWGRARKPIRRKTTMEQIRSEEGVRRSGRCGRSRRAHTDDHQARASGEELGSWWSRWRRTITITFLIVVAVVVSVAVTVLSAISAYFGVYEADIISPDEVALFAHAPTLNSSSSFSAQHPVRKMPRIIHQTWKTDEIPDRWLEVRDSCERLHPSVRRSYESTLRAGVDGEPYVGEREDGKWEYMLWSDEASREFIKREYDWFLPTFDGYTYPIQRADAIRYFVLHRYGGVYMDLDVGCRRPIDPLLYFDVILPVTVPVGVSNDLMFSSRKHPFIALAIHSLVSLDHSYGTNYPTVMFSTGPMAISWVYGLWRRYHDTFAHPTLDRPPSLPGAVRVLPQELYGKNAPPETFPDSFFSHFYGSSWHTDDSGFILWLGRSFRFLLWLGAAVAIIGLVREGFLRCLGARKVGKIRRAAGAVAEAARAGRRHSHAMPVGPSGGLPLAFEGFPHVGDGDGPLRRLRRGQLFFLPAYWVSDSVSRPTSPGGSSNSSSSSWASYLGLLTPPRGHREVRTSEEFSDAERERMVTKIDMEPLGEEKGKKGYAGVGGGERSGDEAEPLPRYTPPLEPPTASRSEGAEG